MFLLTERGLGVAPVPLLGGLARRRSALLLVVVVYTTVRLVAGSIGTRAERPSGGSRLKSGKDGRDGSEGEGGKSCC